MPEVDYRKVEFKQATRFFRDKLNLPTQRWDDLQHGMHTRAFTVAGATQTALLEDFRSAIDKAIADGTTLAAFRKDFDKIVKRHGWSYNGSRGWRTDVMLNTNIRTAYAAGRWEQLKQVKARRPYLVYRHGDSANPRPEHLAWDGLVLSHDDPFWSTHYPPNGWGCSCKVFSVNRRGLKQMGKSAPDSAPRDGSYPWTDKAGKTQRIPNGIDPGWDYHVGEAASGRKVSQQVMDQFKASGEKGWDRLTPGNWGSVGRPQSVPLDATTIKAGKRVNTTGELEQVIEGVLGGPEKAFRFTAGEFTHTVHVDAKALASHVDLARAPFMPFLTEVLENPYEVWMAFERSTLTGKVRLRSRFIKAFDGAKGRAVLVVANVVGGELAAWTMIPTRRINTINGMRVGKLIWSRK